MPYRVVESNDEFCVEKTEDGKVMGCHKTEDDAFAQMRALYAAEDDN
jgi:hypothetical protein|tara:strand:+ start:136 stop:276 length:141 start_codon:yes stop_codon:yes gene_type:complete